jgi:DNA-binding MarR family transcriptional regulator
MNGEFVGPERAALREVATCCLCQKARNTARTLTRFYDQYFAGSGIEPTQFNLLVAIGLSEPVSVVQLAGHLGLERTTLTRNLVPLEREGLVQTRTGADARQRLLNLTQNGRRSLQSNLAIWKKAQQAAAAALGKNDFDRLSEALSLSNKLIKSEKHSHEKRPEKFAR